MSEEAVRELLLWTTAAGIFFAGFALGVVVVVIHAAALARRVPLPKELLPRPVEVPTPQQRPVEVPTPQQLRPADMPAVGYPAIAITTSPSPFVPKPKPTVREARQASPTTRDAYLAEIDRLVTEARAKRKEPKLAADELPPLPARTPLPSIHWADDPHDPQETERKVK